MPAHPPFTARWKTAVRTTALSTGAARPSSASYVGCTKITRGSPSGSRTLPENCILSSKSNVRKLNLTRGAKSEDIKKKMRKSERIKDGRRNPTTRYVGRTEQNPF